MWRHGEKTGGCAYAPAQQAELFPTGHLAGAEVGQKEESDVWGQTLFLGLDTNQPNPQEFKGTSRYTGL